MSTKKQTPQNNALLKAVEEAKKRTFLPDGYKEPTLPGYLKLVQGDHRIRIMPCLNGSPHMVNGTVTWYEDVEDDDQGKPQKVRRPYRAPVGVAVPDDIKATADGRARVFHAFWAYKDEQIYILEITQKTIWSDILALIGDTDWGDPFEYDILITRDDAKKPNMYSVTPKPKSPIPDKAVAVMKGLSDIDLRELYRSGDPFSPDRESPVEDEIEGL